MLTIDSVAMWLISNYNFIWIPLARKIKREFNCKIIGICRTNADKIKFSNQDKEQNIDEYVLLDIFNSNYGKFAESAAEIFSCARRYEEKYKCVYPEIIQTDRHLGRGYSSLGTGHAKSRLSKSCNHIASVEYLNRIFLFWENFYSKYTPQLTMSVGSGVIGKPLALVLRKNGSLMRNLMHAKYMNYFYWASDEYARFEGIEERYKQIISEGATDDLKRQYKAVRFSPVSIDNRKYFSVKPSKTFGKISKLIALKIYKKIRKIETYGNYILWDQVREVISRDFQTIYLLHKKLAKFEDIKNKKYFFYALQTEPETSTTTISPEFNEQLAVIEVVAKALPSEYYLVVKEHPFAIGRRPYFLYSLISQIPNVIFVDFREDAIKIARHSECVVTISGSIGYEATIMGKPVITFGLHNWHNFVENTIVIREIHDIKKAITSALERSNNRTRLEEVGYAFLRALCDMGFEWDYKKAFGGKEKAIQNDELDAIFNGLKRSLSR